MEKLFLLMPDGLSGTRIDLDSQSSKKLTNAEIISPTGITKEDLPELVENLAELSKADKDLGKRIDEVLHNIDPEALDSLTEIVAAFTSADDDLNATILDLVKTVRGEFAAADDAIKAEVGYESRGSISNDLYGDYSDAAEPVLAIEEELVEAQEERATYEAELAKLENDGADQAVIEKKEADIEGANKRLAELKSNLKDFDFPFLPKNEVNFIAWADAQHNEDHSSAREALANIVGDNKDASENADAAIITAVGYDARGTSSGNKYAEYINEATNAEQIQSEIDSINETLAQMQKELADAEDNDAPAEHIASIEANIAAENKVKAEREDSLESISGFLPANEVNFIAWADSKTADDIKDNLGQIGQDIFATNEALAAGDAVVVAAVGYDDRGNFSEAEYTSYKSEMAVGEQLQMQIDEIDANLAQLQKELADADPEDAEHIDNIEANIAAENKSKSEFQAELESYSSFLPKNEVNFIAWLEDKSRKLVSSVDESLNSKIKEEKAASDKADAAIITAVGYQDRGEKSKARHAEYEAAANTYDPQDLEDAGEYVDEAEAERDNVQAALDKAIKDGADQTQIDKIQADLDAANEELDSANAEMENAIASANAIVPFIPVNEVNFIAWADAQDKAGLEGTIKSTDRKLSDRIDFIVKNSEPEALDSLTEIVAAFQSSDSDLSNAFNEIAKNIRSEFAAADTKVRDEFATADTALSSSFAGALTTEASDIRGEFATADTALSSSFAADLATEVTRAEDEEGKIRTEFATADTALSSSFATDLSTEIQARIDGDNALDDKISAIITNDYGDALDSFSEVEEGVNTGFIALKQMIMDVAAGSVEKVLSSPVSDGVEVNYTVSTEKPKVFVNGMLQVEAVDYTVAAGSPDADGHATMVVTFGTAPVSGAQLVIAGVESKHTSGYDAPVVFGDSGPQS